MAGAPALRAGPGRAHAGRTVLVAAAALLLGLAAAASAAWTPPPGVDLTRPRLLFRAADLATIQSRLDGREPYRTVAAGMMQRIGQAGSISLTDHAIASERIKARAAKNLAFFYAVDRTYLGGTVVPFPSPEARQAAGDRARDLLLHMYDRSRLAVPPPLGGWDRDISSSEELIQYATAYDTLRGAGYDFGADEPLIVERIASLAAELYDNYESAETASGFSNLHQNNHRSKTGASIAAAGVALAEHTPAPGTDPRGVREPTVWIELGLDLIDLVMRYALGTTDGAYGEGPFYLRFAAENLTPFLRAWDLLLDGESYPARGIPIPSLWSHPLAERSRRWLLDMTLPDGSLAPIDDGNPGRSYYFGAMPPGSPLAPAFAWRWANAPRAFETEGNVDMGADSIVLYDDSVVPAPPSGSPTAFYFDGGNAIFRSDWSPEAVVALVNGERDVASEFGRDRNGLGVSPQSHEHAEPGAFLLHAFGETLALDPGYLSFTERVLVARPEHHNVILVDGRGPVDYLGASLAWQSDPAGPVPADGQADLQDSLDGDFLDAVRVRTTYGPAPDRVAAIERRFLFADDAYLAVADRVRRISEPTDPPTPPSELTWLVHGNGGETSGGSFAPLADGGRWTRADARLDAVLALDRASPGFATSPSNHEGPNRTLLQHTALQARASGHDLRGALLLYPSRSAAPAPVGQTLELAGVAAVGLFDAPGDRRVLFAHRAPGPGVIDLPDGTAGLRALRSDGRLLLADAHTDGRLRLAWAEGATELAYGGVVHLAGARRGDLGLRLTPGRAEVVVDDGAPEVLVRGLDFVPQVADGACALALEDGVARVSLSRERRFVLRAEGGNSAPAADPGPSRFVPVGTDVALDAGRSCDLEGGALRAEWEVLAAPPDADWVLHDADTLTPWLRANAAGTYRLRLVVIDPEGAPSRPAEVVVRATAPGEDADGDLVPDATDNCSGVPNPGQEDHEPFGGNDVGDACECSDGRCADGSRRPSETSCAVQLRPLAPVIEEGGRIRCRDGTACDADPRPGVCGFDAVLCFGATGPDGSACAAPPIARLRLPRLRDAASRTALVAVLRELPGAELASARELHFAPALAGPRCSEPFPLVFAAPRRHLRIAAHGASRRRIDSDGFRLECER